MMATTLMANEPGKVPKANRGGYRKGAGRPVTGRITTTFAVKASPEYKVWMGELATFCGGDLADVFREAMRQLAEKRGFRPPPLR